jgi:hypothetical protein
LLPEDAFRLYAVSARFPHNLAGQVPWRELRPGVYECRRGTDRIRVVVPGQLPETDHNAVLHLFSAVPDLVRYGAGHYQQRSPDTSSFLYQLLAGYVREGLNMPYTVEDFRRDFTKEFLEKLTPEERIKGLPPKEVLKALELTPEERVEDLPPEEVLKALPREAIEAFLKRQKNGPSAPPD